jgi:hypothetical protein
MLLFYKVVKFCRHKEAPITTSLVLSVQLFLETTKAFLWKEDSTPRNHRDCRVKAQDLVGEVLLEIKHFVNGSLGVIHKHLDFNLI